MIWLCTICNNLYPIEELNFLLLDKNYINSSFVYCKNCWNIRYSKYYCQYCRFRFQGYSCLKYNKNVCYKCRCSSNCGNCF